MKPVHGDNKSTLTITIDVPVNNEKAPFHVDGRAIDHGDWLGVLENTMITIREFARQIERLKKRRSKP